MDLAGSLFPWSCCAVFLAVVVVMPRQLKGSDRLRDMQLSMNASPGLNVAGGVFLLLGAAIAIALGIVFVGAGYAFAWGLFPLAASKLFIIGFYAYVARQPWVSFDDDETRDQL
ncbi:hypothetical protein [Agreia sp. Leaf283]|uniref:hypothetical protein n=1 Tax=Agreia sp. Leaf283 TaxID=1736321 RepID=UPI0006FA6A17|nr:hypothetical protein [Agreia sp. Leaf283]